MVYVTGEVTCMVSHFFDSDTRVMNDKSLHHQSYAGTTHVGKFDIDVTKTEILEC